MKTSVIIATYNGAKFIGEQFDSILAQSVQPDEVIITDDGSIDSTREIVQRYIDEHDLNGAWRLYVNEKNKGYAKNFLDGAMLTTGDIVFFCDQDDIWTLNRIKKMSEVMTENPGINLLCSNLEPFYYEEDTYKWSEKDLEMMKTVWTDQDNISYLDNLETYKQVVINNANIFDPNKKASNGMEELGND